MPISIETIRNAACCETDRDMIFRLRKQVFSDRLGWAVTCSGEQEYDDFDAPGSDYIVIRHRGTVISTCRLLPSMGPTMLADVFPDLLRGEEFHPDRTVVEISRLAATSCPDLRRGVMPLILQELRRYAQRHDVEEFVFVTTVAIERLLRRFGVTVRRFGDGRATLIDGVRSVALRLYADGIPQTN